MKKTLSLIFAMLALGSVGFAVPIDGLFNTGVDNNGNVVAAGPVDMHYVFTTSVLGKQGRVLIPDKTWLTPPADAAWIGPASLADTAFPGGGGDPIAPPAYFTYTLSFTIDGIYSSGSLFGKWATDTGGTIYLNGHQIANVLPAVADYKSLLSFGTTDTSYFIYGGVNTLTFNVYNGLAMSSPGPSGLLVTSLTGTVPDGGMTAALLGAAVSGIAFLRRKLAA